MSHGYPVVWRLFFIVSSVVYAFSASLISACFVLMLDAFIRYDDPLLPIHRSKILKWEWEALCMLGLTSSDAVGQWYEILTVSLSQYFTAVWEADLGVSQLFFVGSCESSFVALFEELKRWPCMVLLKINRYLSAFLFSILPLLCLNG